MSDRFAEVEAALDQLIAAARIHLAAVRAADGASDDEKVWNAYIELNNAAHDYDEALNEVFGEVTPFDLETITDCEDDTLTTIPLTVGASPDVDDPHPRVITVRQRRDYRVPSVDALLRAARDSRSDEGPEDPISTVGEAIVELLQSGDGSLAMLDIPELEPLDGVVVVAETDVALAPDVLDTVSEAESDTPYRLAPSDAVLSRLHERAVTADAATAADR